MYNSAMRSSYSDDYTRRKAIIRAEQPALLTDRNAYVNFLEVQLERVSSACMSVQAYDQKFTDMQAMIIGLEQRSSSTTRLVSLSQQCIEELRANVFTEIEKQAQRSTAMHTELQRSVQILNSKLNTVEEGLHSVSSLPMKVTALEREIARLNLAIQSVDDMTKKSFKDVDIRIDPIESNVADALQSITSLQAAVSRQGLDTSELERRQSNSLMTLENKTAELMSNDRDEVARKLQNLSNKVNYEFENMDKNNHSREAKMMGAIKSDFKAAQEEMHLVRSALEGQIKSSATTVEAAFQSDLNDLRKLTDDRCDNLNGLIQSVKESHDSSVRENAESLRDFASSIQGLAGVQSETTEALDHLRNALSDPSQNIVVSEEAQVDQEITKIMGALSVASQERGRPGAAAAQAKQEVTAPRDAQVASLVPLPASSTGAGLQPRSNQQAVRTSVAASAPTQAKQLVGRKDSVREQPRNAPAGGPTVIADADPELTSSAWLEKVSQPDPSAEASEAGPTADEQELFRQFMVMYKRNSNQPAMQEQLSAGSNPNTNTSSATAAAPVPDSCSSLELSDTEEERAPTVSRSRKPKSSPNEVLRPENYVSSTQAKYLLPKPTPPWVPAKHMHAGDNRSPIHRRTPPRRPSGSIPGSTSSDLSFPDGFSSGQGKSINETIGTTHYNGEPRESINIKDTVSNITSDVTTMYKLGANIPVSGAEQSKLSSSSRSRHTSPAPPRGELGRGGAYPGVPSAGPVNERTGNSNSDNFSDFGDHSSQWSTASVNSSLANYIDGVVSSSANTGDGRQRHEKPINHLRGSAAFVS